MASSMLDAYNVALLKSGKVADVTIAIVAKSPPELSPSTVKEISKNINRKPIIDYRRKGNIRNDLKGSTPSAAASSTRPKKPSTPRVNKASNDAPVKESKADRRLVIKSLLPGVERDPKMGRKNPKIKFPSKPIAPHYPHLRDPSKRNTIPKQEIPDEVHLKIESTAEIAWTGGLENALPLLAVNERNGIAAQIYPGRDKEVVVGLDFGTSSVKVVIGDPGATKAYAVPFVEATGVNAYLLPSRVFEADDGLFSLANGSKVHRDIKLRFLTKPEDGRLCETLVGFFGLVLRRCRAWLFGKHVELFINRSLVWKLVLGRAVAHNAPDSVGRTMANIAHAAWAVAGSEGLINRRKCSEALILTQSRNQPTVESLEVSVVPEISAQVYGFVRSRKFDSKAKNFYLLIDIGAGTVDVSLFRVKYSDDGKLDFDFFATKVEKNGAMNLHRARLKWWRQEFVKCDEATARDLVHKLERIGTATEQTLPIPERYDGYFEGVIANFLGKATSPDEEFFEECLDRQVRWRVIIDSVNLKMVGKVDLDNLPFFLCGGGSRLTLYRKLTKTLHRSPDSRWLAAQHRELAIPDDLVAPGLPRTDYDRLSVAYGLSFVDVGKVVFAKPMTKIQSGDANWDARYIDKDQC
jgi:hypothetical protein